jgi:flavodoxin
MDNTSRFLIIACSHHHGNTIKLAKSMSNALNADIIEPAELEHTELGIYELVGFGSGIYSGKHHEELLNIINRMPKVNNKKAFIFSTSSNIGPVENNHVVLRKMLMDKGFSIIGEFTCPGYNTNSFLRFFGGINKNRPNENDLEKANEFAAQMKATIIKGE